MSLPKGWREVAIGDVIAKKVSQHVPAGTGMLRYIDIGSVDNQAKRISDAKTMEAGKAPSRARQLVRKDDVLVSMTRPNLNAVAQVPPDLDGATASTGFDVLRATDEVLPEWLFLVVTGKAFVGAMSELVQGALYPAVRPSDIRNYRFPLPPLDEQRRIVSRLEALMERSRRARAELSAIPAQLTQARQSLLAAAFPVDLSDKTTLGKLIQRIEAGQSFQCIEQPPKGDTPGIVKVSAMSWGAFDEQESKTVFDSSRLDSAHAIQVGDLLMSRANTSELVGAIVLVDRLSRRLYLSDKSLRLVVPAEWKRWCLHALSSPNLVRQIRDAATGNQHSMRNISQAAIRSLRVSLPTPEERDDIVRRLDAALSRLDKVAAARAAAVAELDRLDQALLARAFSGRLVPQSPAPARPSRTVLKPKSYLIQLVAALLRERGPSLALADLNSVVALLHSPRAARDRVFRERGIPEACSHFGEWHPDHEDEALKAAAEALLGTGTISQAKDRAGAITLHLVGQLLPISPEVEADARHLAVLLPQGVTAAARVATAAAGRVSASQPRAQARTRGQSRIHV